VEHTELVSNEVLTFIVWKQVSNMSALQEQQLCFNLGIIVYHQGIGDFKFPASTCHILTQWY
jgi:hypothetical protein